MMAIKINNKDIEGIFFGKKIINRIYHGVKIVWEFVVSCFNGFWDNDSPWSNSESWKN